MTAPRLEDLSNRISVLRFPLIVAVVFIHAYVVGASSTSAGQLDAASWVSHYVRNFVSQGIARTAVPIFFLIAGYLFYKNFSLSLAAYSSKIRSRTETLLIPFLFWNVSVFLFFAIAQSNPKTSGYFTGSVIKISGLGWKEYFSVILGVGRDPIAYQFWFVRNLIVAAVMSPVLFLVLKVIPKATLAVAFLVWLNFNDIPSAEGMFFFVLGGAAAVHALDIFALDRYGKGICLCYLPLAIADAALWDVGSSYLHMIAMSFGVGSVLYASKFIAVRKKIAEPLIKLAGASFFVFAAHEPLLTICRKISDKVLPAPDAMTGLLYYAAMPALIIFLLVHLCWAISSGFPRFARVIGAGPHSS